MKFFTRTRIILITSILAAFWAPFITSSVNIALPYIATDFSASAALLNWVASSTILAIAIFVLPSGKVADMVGRRKVLLWGVIILAISSLFCAIAQSITFLLIFRVIQGLGSALITTSVVALVSAAFPPNERGKAIGLTVASTYTGLAAGPILGGLIVSFFSWRGVFFFSVPIGFILCILLFKIDDNWVNEDPLPFDYKGTILYALGIFCLVFGLTNIVSYTWSKWLLILGIIIIAIFIVVERKITNPIINVTLFKGNRILIFSSLASLINYSSTFAISYLMSLYLQVVKGLDPGFSGMILLAQPTLQALLSPVAGRLSDRISPRLLASSGMGLITLCLFVLSFLNVNTHFIVIIITLAIVGVGFALFASPNTNAIMGSVDIKYYGVASGILGASRSIGQSLSMSLTALIVSVFIGNAALSIQTIPQFLISLKVTFLIMSGLCLLGVFASLARGKVD